jgi:hypothetical protein
MAVAVSTAEPRIKVVYGREDFTKVPLPERVADYLELRYMGSEVTFTATWRQVATILGALSNTDG